MTTEKIKYTSVDGYVSTRLSKENITLSDVVKMLTMYHDDELSHDELVESAQELLDTDQLSINNSENSFYWIE